jgi:hypothetical protein
LFLGRPGAPGTPAPPPPPPPPPPRRQVEFDILLASGIEAVSSLLEAAQAGGGRQGDACHYHSCWGAARLCARAAPADVRVANVGRPAAAGRDGSAVVCWPRRCPAALLLPAHTAQHPAAAPPRAVAGLRREVERARARVQRGVGALLAAAAQTTLGVLMSC